MKVRIMRIKLYIYIMLLIIVSNYYYPYCQYFGVHTINMYNVVLKYSKKFLGLISYINSR